MSPEEDSVVTILLIEDNPADVLLTQEALRRTALPHNVIAVSDGAQALKSLKDGPLAQPGARPHLILLDWNLPGVHGREVLGALKADALLRRIPVVVLTTSASPVDVKEAYDLHANCFCAKPVRLDDFVSVVSAIEHFWFEIAEIPGE